jgi:hypothetical protein
VGRAIWGFVFLPNYNCYLAARADFELRPLDPFSAE